MIEPATDIRIRVRDVSVTATKVSHGALAAATVTGLGVWIGESGGSGPRVWFGVSLIVGLGLSLVA